MAHPDGPTPFSAAARLAVAGTGFVRAVAELIIFGYLPIRLHSAGEERLTVLALISAIPALVRFVGSGAWGAASSRSGRIKPYLVLGFAALLAVLLLLGRLTEPWAAVLAVSLGSLLFSAVAPLSKSLVSLLASGETSRSLAGWLQAESLGWLVGGAAISWVGTRPEGFQLLLALAAGLIAGELLLILMALPEVPAAAREEKAMPRLLDLAKAVASSRIWRALVAFATLTVASEGTFTVYGIYLTGILGGSERLYGASLTLSTLLGVATYWALGRFSHRLRPERLLPAAATAYGITYVIMTSWRDPLVMAALYALPLYTVARTGVIWQIARETAPTERSAAMGFLDGSEALAIGVGSLTAGAIADGLGFPALFTTFALAAGLVALASRRQPDAEAAGGRRSEAGSGRYSF